MSTCPYCEPAFETHIPAIDEDGEWSVDSSATSFEHAAEIAYGDQFDDRVMIYVRKGDEVRKFTVERIVNVEQFA